MEHTSTSEFAVPPTVLEEMNGPDNKAVTDLLEVMALRKANAGIPRPHYAAEGLMSIEGELGLGLSPPSRSTTATCARSSRPKGSS